MQSNLLHLSLNTAGHEVARPAFWLGRHYDLYDCMHPLTSTTLPLRKFSELFVRQIYEASRHYLLRIQRHLTCPWELDRVY